MSNPTPIPTVPLRGKESLAKHPLPLRGRVRVGVGFALVTCCVASLACAQTYPAKPIRMVIPFPPGGTTDIIGRVAAQKLSEALGQQVVPDNRPGAAGNIGAEQVAKAPPDGYTLITLPGSTLTIHPSLYAKLP